MDFRKNTLEQLQKDLDKINKKEREILNKFKEYCEGKRFKIVKHIYYSGYQGDMIGRECTLQPCIHDGKLQAACTIYNKRTKKIDIRHYYIHDLSFYEEIKE